LAAASGRAIAHGRLGRKLEDRTEQVFSVAEGLLREDVVDGGFEKDQVDVGAAVERMVSA